MGRDLFSHDQVRVSRRLAATQASLLYSAHPDPKENRVSAVPDHALRLARSLEKKT
jgi:hypothetical protein